MKALVSIGIPVFNEEKYIIDTINSALSQTYDNLEIIISDNCSKDGTALKIHDLVNKFDHVDLTIQNKNIGAIENFNYVKKKAKGEFFMWLGGHDIISPDYVQECLEPFQNNDTLILVYSKAKYFPINTESTSNRDASIDLVTIGLNPLERAMKVLNPSICTAIHGVFKMKGVESCFLENIPIGPDNGFLFETSIKGEFYEVGKGLYFRREIRNEETDEERIERYEDIYNVKSEVSYYVLKLEHFKIIKRSGLSLKEKIILNAQVFEVFLKEFPNRNNFVNCLLKLDSSFKNKIFVNCISFQNKMLKLLYKINH